MKSRYLVDPELARFVEDMPGFDLRDDVLRRHDACSMPPATTA